MIGGASGIGFGLGISIGNNNNSSSKSNPKDILFNPKITTNIDLKYIKFYHTNELGVTELNRRIEIGDRIDPNSLEYPGKIAMVISFIGKLNDTIVTNLTVNGTVKEMYNGTGAYAGLDDGYNHANALIPFVTDLNIELTVDEYIRFEDIVQPYPMFLKFKVSPTSTSEKYSWGSKLKVGLFAIAYIWDNILHDLYFVGESNEILLNGEPVMDDKGYPAFYIQKKMVFTVRTNWGLDNNPPKCILFPKLLQIPASSLKYLGYIPDISGNGNHGYLHNFDLDTQYENGVLHFDGVDDYIDFPTMTEGGKQVFMKCKTINWGSAAVLYDQRGLNNTDKFGIERAGVIAYNRSNSGNTYIDGVLNKYISSLDLVNVTHNIVATNTLEGSNNETTTPVIGSNCAHDNYFINMDLYSFMLFDEISSDEDIVGLNKVVGIEGNYVEAPSWYYDTFGKNNSDADKAVIANKGKAIGDYDLQVKNVAFEGQSGYNNDVSFNNPMWWLTTENTSFNHYYVEIKKYETVITVNKFGNPIWGINLTPYGLPAPPDVPPFTIQIEGILEGCKIVYLYVQEDGSTNTYEMLKNGIYTLPASYNSRYVKNPEDVQDARMGFFPYSNTVIEGEPLVIKILNGILLNGVDDYITNANIPAFTDYTYILKRDILSNVTNSASMTKGDTQTLGGSAFITDFAEVFDYQIFYSFGKNKTIYNAPQSGTIYGTKNIVNGSSITPGTSTDMEGINIGKWRSRKNMAFQKLMLYPVTIDNLSINMLRNMFELDNDIDMYSPIFKPYPEYSSIPDFSLFVPRIDVTAILLPDSITITHINGFGPTYLEIKQPIQFLFKPFTVNVEGLTDDVTLYYIYNKQNMINDFELINGENEISYHPEGYAPVGFAVVCYEESLDCNIKITLIK